MSTNDRPDNCLFVIFGASGDLTKRKLIPSLYHLDQMGQVPANYGILGVARSSYSDDEFRDRLFEFSRDSYDAERWGEFSQRIHYLSSDATRADNWAAISERCGELSQVYQTEQNVLFYLSLSPEFFEPVIVNIGESKLVSNDRRPCPEDRPCWQRIVIEKPFGSDPTSAARLNQTLARVFDEESIYRIDHYLGKELVQNIMVVRFANSIFEPLWNQRYIDHVQITATETVGLEGRASYYDGPAGGALRDMVQSHLLQVLSVIAMEPPVTMDDLFH